MSDPKSRDAAPPTSSPQRGSLATPRTDERADQSAAPQPAILAEGSVMQQFPTSLPAVPAPPQVGQGRQAGAPTAAAAAPSAKAAGTGPRAAAGHGNGHGNVIPFIKPPEPAGRPASAPEPASAAISKATLAAGWDVVAPTVVMDAAPLPPAPAATPEIKAANAAPVHDADPPTSERVVSSRASTSRMARTRQASMARGATSQPAPRAAKPPVTPSALVSAVATRKRTPSAPQMPGVSAAQAVAPAAGPAPTASTVAVASTVAAPQLAPQFAAQIAAQIAPPVTAPVVAPALERGASAAPAAALMHNPAMVASPTTAYPAHAPVHAHAHGPTAVIDTPSRWSIFEQLGLGPTKDLSQKTAKLLVSTYRLLGFAVLTLIVVVLVGYITTSAFYFVSDTWIQPTVVSRTDERVIALEAQVAEQENVRDRIIADLNQADRYIAVQQTFQSEFAKAIRADLSGRKAQLSRIRELARDYAGARAKIKRSNQAYAASSRRRMAAEYQAGLIDRSDMLSGKYQLAQITSSNLGLAERQVEYESRAADLDRESKALDAILSQKGGEGALSYDVLRIKQEYEMSRLESAKAIENRTALKASLSRQNAILDGLRRAPYLRAASNTANFAFVPYDNMDEVAKGEPLYRCRLQMVFCSKVGTVVEILPGEVSFKHPQREKILRGRMVELKLENAESAQEDVLFVGGRPLFI